MPNILVYTSSFCPYCIRAKRLLEKKGVPYKEVRVDLDPEHRQEMLAKSNNRRTVPQIFIGELHVGGFDELFAMDREQRLDPLLGLA